MLFYCAQYLSAAEGYFWQRLRKLGQEELALTELADKLEAMSTREDALKDVVVTICCSCDYFDEPQINEMVHIMEETEHLPRENAVRSRLIRSYRAAAMKVRSRDIRQSYVVRI